MAGSIAPKLKANAPLSRANRKHLQALLDSDTALAIMVVNRFPNWFKTKPYALAAAA